MSVTRSAICFKLLTWLSIALGSALTLAPAPASAQYPAKPVRIIVPFAAGGSTDSAARVLANQLEKLWKQNVLVDDRPGGNQIVGVDVVVKSAPDGYNLVMPANPVLYEHLLNKNTPFVGPRDLSPMGIVCGAGLVIAVPNSLPARTFGELVTYIKNNPGKVNWATTGGVTAGMEALRHQLGLASNVVDVAYKGGNLGMMAIVSGEAQVFAGSPLDALELSRAGRLRVIAYTEQPRHPLYPDIPTIGESNVGAPDHRSGFWFGIFGPAGVSNEIVNKVNTSILESVRAPEVAEKYRSLGLQTYSVNPAEMRQMIGTEVKGVETLLAQGVKLR